VARRLPSLQEAVEILSARRTRPAPRPPPAAARALTPMIKALEARYGKGADGLKARWREIVGPVLARTTEPNRLVTPRGGGGATLELRVAGSSATFIQHQAPDILARVNLFLGPGAVVKLRIVQGPLRGAPVPAATVARALRRAKGPLDAAVEQRLAEDLSGFPEGRLKQALTRLGREVLRDPKA
jgi:hypothetical protein